MYNVHPYFSLKILGKKNVHYTRQNMVHFLFSSCTSLATHQLLGISFAGFSQPPDDEMRD